MPGAIGGSIAVLAGGTLSPGTSIQSLAGGATSFAAAAVSECECDSADPPNLGSAAHLLVVHGNLSIDSGALITFADLAITAVPEPASLGLSMTGGLAAFGSTILRRPPRV